MFKAHKNCVLRCGHLDCILAYPMNVLAISGSPSATSKTLRLLDPLEQALNAADIELRRVSVSDFPAEAALLARFDHPAMQGFHRQLAQASGVVVLTPVYQSAYAGALKVLLDLIPEGGLAGKPVLPLVSGGSAGHLLAVDYALKPVLSALKASEIHQGVFAVSGDISVDADGGLALAPALRARLDEAAQLFASQLSARRRAQQAPASWSGLRVCL